MTRLDIDGRQIIAAPGTSVLQAARAAGLQIPTLCEHPALPAVGSCRLCLVEEMQSGHTAAACTLPASDGMVIRTRSETLARHRRMVLSMLLSHYVADPSLSMEQNELLHWAREYEVPLPSGRLPPRRFSPDSDPSPVIRVDWDQCILCTRCIRACADVQGRHVWHLAGHATETRIVAGMDSTMHEARCESCGLCSAVCPTGALSDRHALGLGTPDRLVTTTCGYCGVGCQFDLNVSAGRVVRVTSNPQAPVNGIALCVKGRYGFEYLNHHDRLTSPRVREALLSDAPGTPTQVKQSPWVDVDWKTAVRLVGRRFARIRAESGPDSLGVLASAKCTNEENYLIQKLARQVLGTNNVDHCARLCHASTVAGLTMSYGSGAMSNSMDDVASHAAAMFVIGSNTTEQHPVFGSMIRQAVQHREMPLVVADPRRIDLAEFATLHLRHRPGTDAALVNGLMHEILRHGWHDASFIEQRCEAFEEFAASLDRYSPESVSAITGVPAIRIQEAARILGTHSPMAVVWAMGITQHTTGVLNVLALANLQMLLGNIGKPGGGVNPLRGQNNVQGACDMGALPNVLPGYQLVTDPAVRGRFSDAWELRSPDGSTARQFGPQPGQTLTEMVDAAGRGVIRGLYIVGEDPVMTEPDSHHTRAALSAAEFVVLQEIFPSETAVFADVLLPGAAFAEKSGTFTNTERRVQLVNQATDPPGAALADWQVLCAVADELLREQRLTPAGPHADWKYASSEAVLEEVAGLTPIYAGVSHERLRRGERLQWPVPHPDHPGTPILHVERFTRGKGRFHVVEHLEPHEVPDSEYPLLLTTGRVLYHWHGGELSRRSPTLLAEVSEPQVEISPEDAARQGIEPGATVLVRSRRGELVARAQVTSRVAEGLVFGNFHFAGTGNCNNLTIRALDPIARIPEYKVCAVRIEQ